MVMEVAHEVPEERGLEVQVQMQAPMEVEGEVSISSKQPLTILALMNSHL